MPAYLYNAPAGVPGDITRVDDTRVDTKMLVAATAVYAQRYGIPMVAVTGGIQQYTTGKVAADFVGILARSAPEISGNLNSGFDDTVPNPDQPQNLVVNGYVAVKCTIGTPAFNGVVYIRTVAAGDAAIGDLEATSDPGNNVALSNTQGVWATDGKDADNNAEIRIAR